MVYNMSIRSPDLTTNFSLQIWQTQARFFSSRVNAYICINSELDTGLQANCSADNDPRGMSRPRNPLYFISVSTTVAGYWQQGTLLGYEKALIRRLGG